MNTQSDDDDIIEIGICDPSEPFGKNIEWYKADGVEVGMKKGQDPIIWTSFKVDKPSAKELVRDPIMSPSTTVDKPSPQLLQLREQFLLEACHMKTTLAAQAEELERQRRDLEIEECYICRTCESGNMKEERFEAYAAMLKQKFSANAQKHEV